VAVFCRERPSDLETVQQAARQLEETLTQAELMAKRERAARLAANEAVAERSRLAVAVHADLRLLALIADLAGEESAGVRLVIRFPGPRRSATQFLTGARVALDTARERETFLATKGLTPGHLDELALGLDRMEAWNIQRSEAAQAHIIARQELLEAGRRLRELIELLDALNVHRFREAPGSLSAWLSAAGIRMRRRKAAADTTASGDTPTPALPPGGPAGLITGS
jgi:hypothetical protein